MKCVNKKELIQLIEQAIPDDAKILGASAMAGETFDLTVDSVRDIFVPSIEVIDEYDYIDDSDLLLVTV